MTVTPTQFDLAQSIPILPGTPISPAQALCGNVPSLPLFPASTLYVGLMMATRWQAGLAVSVGEYIIPFTPIGFVPTDRHIQVCTTAGTTGSTQPTWNETPGGTTADGTAVFTEASLQFAAGDFQGSEPSGFGYARASFDNAVVVNYLDPLNLNPAIQWPGASGGLWGSAGFTVAIGLFVVDAATGDATTGANVWAWGLFSQPVDVSTADVAPAMALGTQLPGATAVQIAVMSAFTGTTATIPLTMTRNGNQVVVAVTTAEGSTTSIADTSGGTWTLLQDSFNSSGGSSAFYARYQLWVGTGVTGSATITVTGGGGSSPLAVAFEVQNGKSALAGGAANGNSVSPLMPAIPVYSPGTFAVVGIGTQEGTQPPYGPGAPWTVAYNEDVLAWYRHGVKEPTNPVAWGQLLAEPWAVAGLYVPPVTYPIAA